MVKNKKFLFDNKHINHNLIANALVNSIYSLLNSGKKVILIYPVPEAG